MKRLASLFLAALLAFAPLAQADLRASSGAFGPVAVTSGTITGTNAPYVVGQAAIPFIAVSSGTMGNNGALSAITALGRTYAGGAYIYLPAGAIAAGVPAAAAWYWCVFSSTTAGTVYNSIYTSGVPVIGTQTAFVTTGPGAFTGVTTEVPFPTVTIPAGAMGPNGRLRITTNWSHTNSAGTKAPRIYLGGTGGTLFLNPSFTTTTAFYDQRHIANAGSASAQVGPANNSTPFGAVANPVITAAINTANAQTIAFASLRNTATDNHVLEDFCIEVMFAP